MTGRTARSWALTAGLVLPALVGCECEDKLQPIVPVIAVSPDPVVFGPVAVGSAAERLVDVRNDGKGELLIDTVVVSEGAAEVSVTRVFTSTCQGAPRSGNVMSIIAGDCARFAIRVLPKEKHPISAKILIRSNATNTEGEGYVLPVTADGVVAGMRACVLTPEGELAEEACTDFSSDPAKIPELDFGPVPLGSDKARQVRLFNLGEGTLTVTNAHVESEVPDLFVKDGSWTGDVAPGASADVEVHFAPQGSGVMTGKLLLPSNDVAHPTVELPVKAEGQGPGLCFNPENGVDFGTVPVGQSRKLNLQIENCGFVDYDITTLAFNEYDLASVEYAVKWLTIDGQPAAAPVAPFNFPPGKQLFAEITYTPRRVHGANDQGDTAGFAIRTTYQTGTIPVVGKGEAPECDGIVPTAKFTIKDGNRDITANPVADPLRVLTLDGSSSTVPSGGPVYLWRLVRQPQGGTQGLSGSIPSRRQLFLELAGEYEVELIAKDQFGCQSVPVSKVINSVPQATLHIQLTWPESHGDIDLHLLGPGSSRMFDEGTFINSASDCFYATCKEASLYYNADWGSGNQTRADGRDDNNPTLDIDALWGKGPENINMNTLFDGTYKINAHYYCSRQSPGGNSFGAATATLKVFVAGQQRISVSQQMRQRQIWEGAIITVSNGGTQVTVTPGSPNLTLASGEDSCTSATN